MNRLSDALVSIVEKNSFLQFGLSRGLLNLSRTAEYLRPFLETETKKSVSSSSVLMALSRLSRAQAARTPIPSEFRTDRIQVRSGLSVVSLQKHAAIRAGVSKFHARMQEVDAYCTVAEGTAEIMLAFETLYTTEFETDCPFPILDCHNAVSGIGVRFPPQYVEYPGFLSVLLEPLRIHGINLVEIASTRTETILYVCENDTKLAFETLFERFCSK
ncbi:MAG TPA: hypothetical protein PK765_00560 [bacterium]|nr:hypothetical protein [bacterium]